MAGISGHISREGQSAANRLRWIETWAQGWQQAVGGTHDDSLMPLDVATSMILELLDPRTALDILAERSMESGMEIGEAVEARRG
jgi:hypothetical protein